MGKGWSKSGKEQQEEGKNKHKGSVHKAIGKDMKAQRSCGRACSRTSLAKKYAISGPEYKLFLRK